MNEQYIKSKTINKILGNILVPFLGAFILMWFNHIWFIKQIGYWKCFILAIPFYFFVNVKGTKDFLKYPYLALFLIAIFCQLLAWMEIIKLPLINNY